MTDFESGSNFISIVAPSGKVISFPALMMATMKFALRKRASAPVSPRQRMNGKSFLMNAISCQRNLVINNA